jgi:hypothetical protein
VRDPSTFVPGWRTFARDPPTFVPCSRNFSQTFAPSPLNAIPSVRSVLGPDVGVGPPETRHRLPQAGLRETRRSFFAVPGPTGLERLEAN